MATKATERENVNLALDSEIMERITDYWHHYHFKNRTAAIRFLLRYALDKSPKPTEKDVRGD